MMVRWGYFSRRNRPFSAVFKPEPNTTQIRPRYGAVIWLEDDRSGAVYRIGSEDQIIIILSLATMVK